MSPMPAVGTGGDPGAAAPGPGAAPLIRGARMNIRRTAGRALLAVALCAATALAVPAPAQAGTLAPTVSRDQVLAVDVDPKLTVAQLRDLAGRDSGPVRTVLGVRGTSPDLTAAQVDGLRAGRVPDGLQLIGTVADPTPDTTVGDTIYRMKIPGQRIIIIRGEIIIDGLPTPVLIIIILAY